VKYVFSFIFSSQGHTIHETPISQPILFLVLRISFFAFSLQGEKDHFNQCSLQCRSHAAPGIGY